MKEKAVEYFKNGYSCSESILKAAIDEGYIDKSLFSVATSFSGGMSSGCLCGAVAGAQIVIGYMFGKNNKNGNEEKARVLAKKMIDMFKERNKFTCCKALTAGLDFASPERKHHCFKMVEDAAEILETLIKEN